ncbi:lipoyl(octanoyl) transferase LipB [Denitratisoma oestradiolicum]|uniref:Octanoyltransferase n=1 Tax=Denitratisoma oestradiolicum TaxID=311182 RepID=A0A6S6Y105_9PROT|nr:lipoyl(octanoyl) transferase LipB [Denitratisoma oestradiolicum]TWO79654.1 octanoyltransferase [Denitratisoma oestradiolicum]CAB1370461.1 lipoyl-protein ligase [Denitratisoma oestradiolicum]
MGKGGSLIIRRPGRVDYEPTWRAMQAFTAGRDLDTPDEIWLLEHPPVFTQGQAGKPEHLLGQTDIPVVKIDRGGQITYHGPGQLVAYLLIDLRRKDFKVREMVQRMEQALIDLLAGYGITARRQAGAPGVYVGEAKVAALGLRVKNGCSYHGLSLNVDMDLAPFASINPCGYAGLAVTQLKDLGVADDLPTVGEHLLVHLKQQLDYHHE